MLILVIVAVLVVEVLVALAGVDLRRVPDALAGVVLLAAVGVALAALVRATRGTRGRVAAWIVAAAVAAAAVTVLVVVGDLRVWFALFAFLTLAFALLAMLAITLAALVALARWRRSGAAAPALAAVLSLGLIAVAGSSIWWLNPRPPSVPQRFATRAELDAYLKKLVASGSPPSISVLVQQGGRPVYAQAFGAAYAPDGTRATLDTVDKWWSVTKVATAVAVLQLAEQGTLRLDQQVRQLLPSFNAEPASRAAKVTVADLLNHSAGLPNNVPQVVSWMRLEGDPAFDQLELFKQRFPEFAQLEREPGRVGVYSNVDYMALGALIEQVSGEPYERYVVDHVLRPLGMRHTGFAYSSWMRAHEGVGSHPAANFETLFLPVVQPPWPSSYVRDYDAGLIWFNRFLADNTPPTGLIGTAPDMMRLAEAILAGGELDGRRILSATSVKTLLAEDQVEAASSPERDELNAPDVRHGIAFFVAHDHGRLYYEQSGGGPGWNALMRIYPRERLAIVTMGNGTVVPADDLADAIAASAHALRGSR